MENIQFYKDNWSKISINDYFKIKDVLDNDDDLLDKNISILSIVTNYSIDELESMSFYKLNKLFTNIDFINKEIKQIKIPDIIKLDNRLYVIDNNGCQFEYININKEINKLTITEYINFNELANDPKNIHRILSIFMRPIKYKRNIFGKNEVINIEYNEEDFIDFIYNNINIVLANSLMVFFSQVLNRLINYIKISLDTEMKKMKIMMIAEKWKNKILRRNIPINGDGLDVLIELQKILTEVGMMSMN